MRRLLSNTGATRVFAETLQKPEGKGQRAEGDDELKHTEMFIRHSAGNDCVDLCFEKHDVRVPCDFSSSATRTFACVFVDVYSLNRHS
jgi:hypothetical protein